jgi:hypothetical protein
MGAQRPAEILTLRDDDGAVFDLLSALESALAAIADDPAEQLEGAA